MSTAADNGLRTSPAVIVTSVSESGDTAMSSRSPANAYLVDPAQMESFELTARTISDFGVTQIRMAHEPAR